MVLAPDGTLNILSGLVRAADCRLSVGCVFPAASCPRRRSPILVPDLAVEVLSKGNTTAEMKTQAARLLHVPE